MSNGNGEVPPKGKVDFFGLVVNGATSDPQFDPGRYLYLLDRDIRSGQREVHPFEPESIREEWGKHPMYKDAPDKLDADIKTVGALYQALPHASGLAKSYRPPSTLKEKLGNWDRVPLGMSGEDPFHQYSGTRTMPVGAGQGREVQERLARDPRGLYVDKYGVLTPFRDEKEVKELLRSRTGFTMDYVNMVDEEGRKMAWPVARLRPEGADEYAMPRMEVDAPVYGRWWELGASAWNTVGIAASQVASLGSGLEDLTRDVKYDRLRALHHVLEYHGMPNRQETMEEWVSRGKLYGVAPLEVDYLLNNRSGGRDKLEQFLTPEESKWARVNGVGKAMYLYGPDQKEQMTEERLYEFIKSDLVPNEKELRSQAKEGDQAARAAVDILDYYHGYANMDYWDRMASEYKKVLTGVKVPDNMKIDDLGTFSSVDGIMNIMGNALGYVVPTRAAAGLAAGVIRGVGSRTLVGNAIAKGAQGYSAGMELTAAGGRLAGGVGLSAPAFMAGADFYQAARDVGYDKNVAFNMMAGSFPMLYASELLLGNWMTRSYMNASAKQTAREVIGRELKRAMPDSKSQYQALIRAQSKFMDWLSAGHTTGVKGFLANTGEAVVKESLQEGFEEVWQITEEKLTDYFTGKGLFKQSQGIGYDPFMRVVHAMGAGAIGGGSMGFLGGTRRPKRFDGNIYAAVARGEAGAIERDARDLHKEGAITKEELDVVLQDVALATDAIGRHRINNPEVIDEVLGDQTLTTMLSSATARRDEISAELQAMAQEAEGQVADPARKAALEQELQTVETGIQYVLSGKRFVDKTENYEAFSRIVNKGDRDWYLKGGVQGRVANFEAFSAQERERMVTAKLFRDENVDRLNKAIDNLIGKTGEALFEANVEWNAVMQEFHGKGALSKEDLVRAGQAIAEAREKSLDLVRKEKNMGAMVMGETKEDGTTEQVLDPTFEEQWTLETEPEFRETGSRQDFGEWFDEQTQGWVEEEHENLRQEGVSTRTLLADSEQAFNENAKATPPLARLEKGVSDGELMQDFIASMKSEKGEAIRLEDGGLLTIDKLLSHLEGLEKATPEDMAMLVALGNELRAGKAFPDAVRNVMGPVAGSLAKRYSKDGKLPQAMQEYVDAHGKAKGLVDLLPDGHDQMMADLEHRVGKLQEKLGDLMDVRGMSIERSHKAGLIMKHRMLIRASAVLGETVGSDGLFTSSLARLEELFALDREGKLDAKGWAEVDKLVWRMMDVVSEHVVGKEKAIKALVDGLLDGIHQGRHRNPDGTLRPIADYLQARIANQFDHANLLDVLLRDNFLGNGWVPPSENDASLAAGTFYAVNFVDQVARTRVSDLSSAFDATIKDPKRKGAKRPTLEQRAGVMRVAAFLANPDHGTTEAILNGAGKANASLLGDMIPGSIALIGKPGAGKTTMLDTIISTVRRMRGKGSLNIVSIGPSAELGLANKSALSEGGMNAVADMTMEGLREGRLPVFTEESPDPDLIVVDEGHGLSRSDADVLRNLKDRYPSAGVLTLGDPAQVPSDEDASLTFPLGNRSMRTEQFNTSLRTSNTELFSLQENLHPKVVRAAYGGEDAGEVFTMPSTRYVASTGHGIRIVKVPHRGRGGKGAQGDVVDLFIEQVKGEFAGERTGNAILVVGREDEVRGMVDRLVASGVDHKVAEARVLSLQQGPHSAQGLERELVYVALDPADYGKNYARYIYTAITRAKHGVVVYHPGQATSTAVEKLPTAGLNPNEFGTLGDQGAAAIETLADDLRTRTTLKVAKQQEKKDDETSTEQKGEQAVREEERTDREDDGIARDPVREDTSTPEGYANGAESEEDNPNAYAQRYRDDDPWMAGTAGDLAENTSLAADEQFTTKNPAYKQRLQNLKVVSQALNSPIGVPLSADLVKVRKKRPGAPQEYDTIEVHVNGRSIGGVFLATITKGPYARAVTELRRRSNDPEWKNGTTIPEYSGLGFTIEPTRPEYVVGRRELREEWPDGLREEFTPLSTFTALMEAKGFSTGPAMMLPGGGQGSAWSRQGDDGLIIGMPAISMDVQLYEGGPVHKVFFQSKAADAGYFGTMRQDLDRIVEQTDDTKALDDSEANQFMLWNSSLLVDQERNMFRDDVQDLGTITLGTSGEAAFIVDGGKVRMVYAKEERGQRNMAQRVKALKEALAVMEKVVRSEKQKLTMWPGVEVVVGDQGAKAIRRDHLDRLVTVHKDIHLPTLFVRMPTAQEAERKVVETPPAASASERTGDEVDFFKEKERKAKRARFEAQEKVEEYYRRILGNRFVDGKLEFLPNVTSSFGRALWGVMRNAAVELESRDGLVYYGVGRHEAVHYVIEHLLSPESKEAVLQDAKEKYAKRNGVEVSSVTYRDAHELISKQYESPTYDTTTLLGRFVRWLKGVLKRFSIYQDRIDDLLYQIENGTFRDVDEFHGRGEEYAMAKDPHDREEPGDGLGEQDGTRGEDPANPVDVPPQQATVQGRVELTRRLGAASRVQAAVQQLGRRYYPHTKWAAPNEKSYKEPPQGMMAAYEKVWSIYKAQRDAVVAESPMYEGPDGAKGWDTVTPEEFDAMDQVSRNRFMQYQMGDRAVFNAMTQEVFPGIDVATMDPESMADGWTEASDGTEFDLAGSMVNVVHDQHINSNPLNRQSGLAKLVMGNLQDIRIIPGRGPVESSELGDRIDPQVAAYTMQLVAQFAQTQHDEGGEFGAMAKGLRRLAGIDEMSPGLRMDPTTREAAAARTIYFRFFAMDSNMERTSFEDRLGRKSRSYLHMMANEDVLAEPFLGTATEKNVRQNAAIAREIMVQVAGMHLGMKAVSVHEAVHRLPELRRDQMDRTLFRAKGSIRHRDHGWDGLGEVENNIKEQLRSSMFIMADDQLMVDPQFRKKWHVGSKGDHGDAQFTIDQDGVREAGKNGQWVVRFGKGKAHGAISNATMDAELVNSFFAAAGRGFDPSTVEAMVYGGRKGMDLSTASEAAGLWGAMIALSMHQADNGGVMDRGHWAYKFIEAWKGTHGGIQVNAEGDLLQAGAEADLADAGWLDPTSAFSVNKKLARMEFQARGYGHLATVMGYDGNPMYPVNHGTLMSMLLPSAVEGHKSSDALRSMGPLLAMRDPALRAPDGRWLLPIMDPLSPYAIVDHSGGYDFKEDVNGIGAKANKLSALDLATLDMDHFFKRLVLGTTKKERLTVMGPPRGNRSRLPYLELEQPFSGRLVNLSYNDQGRASVTVNHGVTVPVYMKLAEYHHRHQLDSMSRWFGVPVFAQAIGKDWESFSKGRHVGEVLADMEKALASIQQDQTKAQALIEQVRSNVALREHAEYLGDGVNSPFTLGHSTMMDLGRVFTMENIGKLSKWFGKSEQEQAAAEETVMSIVRPHMEAWKDELLGRKDPETGKRDPITGVRFEMPDGVTARLQEDHEALYDAHWHAAYLTGKQVNIATMGATAIHGSTVNENKRGVLDESPGIPALPVKGGFEKGVRIAVVEESYSTTSDGSRVAHMDGQMFDTPWGWVRARTSFGANTYKQGVNKTILRAPGAAQKGAVVAPSLGYLKKNPWLQDLFRRSLVISPERMVELQEAGVPIQSATLLMEAWDRFVPDLDHDDGVFYWEGVQGFLDWARKEGLDGELIDVISSESNMKVAKSGVNRAEAPYLVSQAYDTRFYRYQTKLYRDVEGMPMSSPYPVQLSSLLAPTMESPQDIADVLRIHELEAESAREWVRQAEGELDALVSKDPENPWKAAVEWTRALVRKKLATPGTASHVLDLLAHQNANLNDPQVRAKVFEMLANTVTREAINPKTYGFMFTQATAHGLMVTDSETGLARELRPPVNAGGQYVPGEVMMPFTEDYARRFRISEHSDFLGMTMGELRHHIKENYGPEELTELMRNLQENRSRNVAAVDTNTVADLLDHIEKVGGKALRQQYFRMFQRQYELGIDNGWRGYDMATVRSMVEKRMGPDGLADFENAMLVFVARTPSSGMGSGHWMKVVEFINDQGNTIFNPAGMNKPSGADYDGDQVAAIFWDPRRKGASTDRHNEMRERLMSLWLREGNGEKAMMEVGTERFMQVLDQAEAENPGLFDRGPYAQESGTPLYNLHARKRSFDGDVLIGIGANYMKAYSYLTGALRADPEAGRGWMPAVRDAEGRLVIDNISQVLNAMLDNTKLDAIGRAGISIHNLALVMGSLANGSSLKEAVTMVMLPGVREAVKKMELDRSFVRGHLRNEYRDIREAIEAQEFGDQVVKERVMAALDVGETLQKVADVVKINTKGVLSKEEDHDAWKVKMEGHLGMDLSTFLQDGTVDGAVQEEGSGLVDLPRAIRAMPNIMAHLEAVDKVERLRTDVFIHKHPLVRDLEQRAAGRVLGENKRFTADQAKVYKRRFMEFLFALYADQRFGKTASSRPTLGGRAYDLHRPGDSFRFSQDFPRWFQKKLELLSALHEGDRRKRILKDNLFLRYVQVVGRNLVEMQVRDARKAMSNQELQEDIRNAARSLRHAFTGEDIMGQDNVDVVELLSLYSALKDKFNPGRRSLWRLLPPDGIKGWQEFQLEFHERLNSKETPIEWTLSDKTPVDLGGLMDRFMLNFERAEAGMAPRGVEAREQGRFQGPRGAELYHLLNDYGGRTGPMLYEAGGKRLDMPWHPFGLQMDVLADQHLGEVNVYPGIDRLSYAAIRDGEGAFTAPKSLNWDSRYPVVLPTGETVPIKKIEDGGRTVRLDPSFLGRKDPRSGESTGFLHSINRMSPGDFRKNTDGFDIRSLFSRINHDKSERSDVSIEAGRLGSMDALLSDIASQGSHPVHVELAKFLSIHGTLFQERKVLVATEEFEDGRVHGEVDRYGNIYINQYLARPAYERAMLHEAMHVFTMHVLSKPVDQLTPYEKRYREEMERLLPRVQELAKGLDLGYVIDSTHEMVARAMTEPRLQAELKNVQRGTLWQRFINALRNLFGLPSMGNSDLSRIVGLTEDYIRYQSATGRTFAGELADLPGGRLWSKRTQARQQGVHEDHGEVNDIRDLVSRMLTEEAEKETLEQASRREMVKQVFATVKRERAQQNYKNIPWSIQEAMRPDGTVDEAKIRSIIRENVLPRMDLVSDRKKRDLIRVFTKEDPDKAFDSEMPGLQAHKNWIFDQVAHRPGDLYLMYSELSDREKVLRRGAEGVKEVRVKDLGIKPVPGFTGYNPMVQVRMGPDGGVSLSMYDFTDVNLDNKGAMLQYGPLLRNYVDRSVRRTSRGLKTPGNLGGAKMFMQALVAMSIRHGDRKIKFRRMKVMSLQGDRHQVSSTWMPDMVREIKLLLNSPAFVDSLPEAVRKVVTDPLLHDGMAYNQSMLDQYIWHLRESVRNEDRKLAEDIRTRFDNDGPRTELLRALALRMRDIEEAIPDEQERNLDHEYRLVQGAYFDVKAKGIRLTGDVKDTSSFMGSMFRNPMSFRGDAVQMAVEEYKRSTHWVGARMNALMEELHQEINKVEPTVMKYLRPADTGWNVFARLQRYSATSATDLAPKVYAHGTNDLVKVPLSMVHWNENDPATKKAMEDGDLTIEEVRLGRWIAEKVHEALVEGIAHRMRMNGNHTGLEADISEAKSIADAKALVDQVYPMGWVPVVQAPVSESLTRGNFRAAMKGLWMDHKNMSSIFNNDIFDDAGQDVFGSIANKYLSEVDVRGRESIAGNATRLARLGLDTREDGTLELRDPDKGSLMSLNLETVLVYVKLAVLRQRIHEERTLPMLRVAKSYSMAMKSDIDQDQKNNVQTMTNWAMRMIHGQRLEKDQLSLAGMPVDLVPIINMAITGASFTGVALSPIVAVKSMMYNLAGAMTTAVTSSLAKDGVFGVGDVTKALATAMTPEGARKMEKLMRFYAIAESQERDFAHNPRTSRTKRNWATSHMANYGNWWTDYNMRGVVMMAQMMKEGSWEAHSVGKDGKVAYDQTKDKRFYHNGVLTKDGEVLVKGLRNKLIEDGVHGQVSDGKLVAGYDSKQAGFLKWLNDRYVMGGMDASEHANANGLWYYRMFLTFRQFFITKLHSWNAGYEEQDAGGAYMVVTDPETGKQSMEWEKREFVGHMRALFNATAILTAKLGIGGGEVRALTKAEKRSMGRALSDMVMMALLMVLAQWLFFDDDEEKKRKSRSQVRWNKRFYAILTDVAGDSFYGTIPAIVDEYGSNRSVLPVVSMGRRIFRSMFDWSKVPSTMPGLKQIYEGGKDIVSPEE